MRASVCRMIRSISPRSVWEHSRARAGRWVLYSVVERAQFSAVGLAVCNAERATFPQAVARKKAICHGELELEIRPPSVWLFVAAWQITFGSVAGWLAMRGPTGALKPLWLLDGGQDRGRGSACHVLVRVVLSEDYSFGEPG